MEEADLLYKQVNMVYLHLISVPELVLHICLNFITDINGKIPRCLDPTALAGMAFANIVSFFSKVFHNCTCIGQSSFPYANMSAVLGQCPRKDDCDYMFKFYMGVSVIGAFLSACGATPSYIILLR